MTAPYDLMGFYQKGAEAVTGANQAAWQNQNLDKIMSTDLAQKQATLEKTQLSNLVTNNSLKISTDSHGAVQAATKTPEYQEAVKAGDTGKQLEIIAKAQGSAGDTEGMVKSYTAAGLADARKASADLKKAEASDKVVNDVYASLQGIDETKFKDLLDRMPPEQKKAIAYMYIPLLHAASTPEERNNLHQIIFFQSF